MATEQPRLRLDGSTWPPLPASQPAPATHRPVVVRRYGAFQPECTCGWNAPRVDPNEAPEGQRDYAENWAAGEADFIAKEHARKANGLAALQTPLTFAITVHADGGITFTMPVGKSTETRWMAPGKGIGPTLIALLAAIQSGDVE
jgi:hypothetical protein